MLPGATAVAVDHDITKQAELILVTAGLDRYRISPLSRPRVVDVVIWRHLIAWHMIVV